MKLKNMTGLAIAGVWLGFSSVALATFNYANTPNSFIFFDGASHFTFTPAANNLRITSGTANGLLGELTGNFTIGTISPDGFGGSMAPVGGTGTMVIHDGANDLTATVVWDSIDQAGTGDTLNFNGVLNLSAVSYAGSNPDLLALKTAGAGYNVLTFQFVPAVSLSVLKGGPGSHQTSFSGSEIDETCTGEIGDFVWNDLNGNGCQEAGEPGIPNVQVDLYSGCGANAQFVTSTTTDSTGHYLFTGLCAGMYSIGFHTPAGFVHTLALQSCGVAGGPPSTETDSDCTCSGSDDCMVCVTLPTSDTQDLSIDCGYVKCMLNCSITASVPKATPGIGGYTASVADAGPGAQYVWTIDNGTITAGQNTSTITWTAGSDTSKNVTIAVAITSGLGCTANCSTYVPLACVGAIGDFVWNDLNANGCQEAGEPGIPGVQVDLYTGCGQNAQYVASMTTDSTGHYLFSGLCAGTYSIGFHTPAGYVHTLAHQSCDGTGNPTPETDSDCTCSGSEDCQVCVTLPTSGTQDLTIDCGYVKCKLDCSITASISQGVPGVSGYTASVADAGPNAQYVWTIDNGTITAGQNTSTITWTAGTDTSKSVTISVAITSALGCTTSCSTSVPLLCSGEIGDFVWNDLNGNGCQDAGEPGISGVTVELYNGCGATATYVMSTTTDVNGYYHFSGLCAGTYSVKFHTPPGYVHTYALQNCSVNGLPSTETDSNCECTGTDDCMVCVTLSASNTRDESIDCGYVACDVNCAITASVANAYAGVGGYTASVQDAGPGAHYTWTISNGTITSGQGTTTITWTAGTDTTKSVGLSVSIVTGLGCTANCQTSVPLQPSPTGCTFTPGGWGAPPKGNNVATILYNMFPKLYSKGFVVGGTYTIKFTSASAITLWLPSGKTPGVLKHSYVNPTVATEAGEFADQVVALKLNVDASNNGYTKAGLATLHIAAGSPLAGKTVAQVLTLANQVLGGSISALPAGMTVSDLTNFLSALNQNFDNCTGNGGVLTF